MEDLALNQVNLVVRDMAATLAFYGLLGLDVPDESHDHAEVTLANGMTIEWDTAASVALWDSAWFGATAAGGVVLGFAVPTGDEVDATYERLTSAGHRGHQIPYDAFWGARYAIVEDPDGHLIGLMGPRDPSKQVWPPPPPPTGG